MSESTPQYTQAIELERQTLPVQTEFSDAHCHLNLFDDPRKAISEAREKGVSVVITAGGSGKDNLETLELLEHEHVFAVVGIGPDFATQDSSLVDEIEALVKTSRKIVGIGEIGIDVKVGGNDIALQKEIFRKQVQVANGLGMPVVIHSRGALDEVFKVLESENAKRALFHFFEGDEKQALELAKKGYLISIPPAWTGRRKRIIKEVDLNSLVVETDSPIVGKTPADVIGVCETIAKLKGVSLEEVATKTTENIRRLFYI